VISDIPGFGVGALEHVYHGLTKKYPGRFALAPFTGLAEPRTVELLRRDAGGDLEYIYRAQLLEADLILLNKCDLLDEAGKQADLQCLRETYPQARVIPISALRGEGMEELALALKEGKASMRRPDIGYGGRACKAAMRRMSEYYLQYHAAVCCNDFDGNAYLMALARRVQADVQATGYEIPHLKLLAWEPEGDFGKVDLLGTDRPLEVTRRFARPCTDVAVILNANAACPAAVLDGVIRSAVEETSDRYQLELRYFKKECFNLGE
jgi:hypothetical protein